MFNTLRESLLMTFLLAMELDKLEVPISKQRQSSDGQQMDDANHLALP